MALLEIKVPSPGESVTEVTIDSWLKQDGDVVQRDDALAEIQSDKAMLTLYAEAAGKLKIVVAAGQTIAVGTVVCRIDTAAAGNGAATTTQAEVKKEAVAATTTTQTQTTTAQNDGYAKGTGSPSAEKLMREQGIAAESIQGSGRDGRITKADVVQQGAQAKTQPATTTSAKTETKAAASSTNSLGGERRATRTKMTQLRKTLAHRLVSVKNETAMLTTFNEVDMTAILELRKKYKETFKAQHEVNLGFMSFFAKACVEGLRHYPTVGAQIDGDEFVSFNYVDMGIAVSTDRGLMVPVVRGVDSKSLADIEKEIGTLAEKARGGKITIDEMMGGTFTITNGGVFGSLMSTPILNPPQSAILGMHKTQERPVVVDGQIVIRPMMYVALSYDHRVIDGRESVSFLVKVKECLEDPMRLLLHV